MADSSDILLTIGGDPSQLYKQIEALQAEIIKLGANTSVGGLANAFNSVSTAVEGTSKKLDDLKGRTSQVNAALQKTTKELSSSATKIQTDLNTVNRLITGLETNLNKMSGSITTGLGNRFKSQIDLLRGVASQLGSGVELDPRSLAVYKGAVQALTAEARTNRVALGEMTAAADANAKALTSASTSNAKLIADINSGYDKEFANRAKLSANKQKLIDAETAAQAASLAELSKAGQKEIDRQTKAAEEAVRLKKRSLAEQATADRQYSEMFGKLLDKRDADTLKRHNTEIANMRRFSVEQQNAVNNRISQLDKLIVMEKKLADSAVGSDSQARRNVQDAIRTSRGGPNGIGGVLPTEDMKRLNAEMKSTLGTAGALDTGFGQLAGRLARTGIVIGGMVLAFKALEVIQSTIQFALELDAALVRLNTTTVDAAEKAALQAIGYKSIKTAMVEYGVDLKKASDLTFELSKAVGGSADKINGAFLPALALVRTGEVDAGQAVRILVGAFNQFGDSLTTATTTSEKFTQISNILLQVANNSAGGIKTLLDALQFAGGQADLSRIKFEELVVVLGFIQNRMTAASRSGTGVSQVLAELSTRSREVAQALGFANEIDFSKPIDQVAFFLKVLDEVNKLLKEAGGYTPELAERLKKAFPGIQETRVIAQVASGVEELRRQLTGVNPQLAATKNALDEMKGSMSAAADILKNKLLFGIDEFRKSIVSNSDIISVFEGIGKIADDIGNAFRRMGLFVDQIKQDWNSISNTLGNLPIPSFLRGDGRPKNDPGVEANWMAGLSGKAPADESQLGYLEKLALRFTRYVTEVNAAKTALKELNKVQIQAANSAAELEARGDIQPFREKRPLQVFDQNAINEGQKTVREGLAKLTKEAQDAAKANNPEVEIEFRIKYAEGEVARFTKKTDELRKIAIESGGIKGKEIDLENKDTKAYLAEYDKLLNATNKAASLRNQAREEGARKTKKLNDEEAKLLLLSGKAAEEQLKAEALRQKAIEGLIDLEEDLHNRKVNFADSELEILHKQIEARRTLDNRKVDKLASDLAGTAEVLSEEDYQRILRAREAIKNLAEDAKKAAVIKTLGDLFKSTATDAETLAAAIEKFGIQLQDTLDKLPKLSEGGKLSIINEQMQKFVDKAFGLEKLNVEFRDLDATIGKFGPEAAIAAAAAQSLYGSLAAVQLAADMGSDAAIRFLITLEGIGKTVSKITIKKLEQEVLDLEKAMKITSTTFGQSGVELERNTIAINATGKSFAELRASVSASDQEWADWIDKVARARAEAKLLNEVLALQAIGLDKVTASQIAQQNESNRVRLNDLQTATAAIAENNAASTRFYLAQIENAKALAQRNGDVWTFFSKGLTGAAVEAGDFWANLDDLAKNTAQAMSSNLSDFFFNVLQGNINSAEDAFKNFFTSLLREVSNFLAKQVVKQFLQFFTGESGGGILNVAGAGFANVGGGTVTVNSNNTTTTIASPEQSGVATNFGSVGFGAGTGGIGGVGGTGIFGQLINGISGASTALGSFQAILAGWDAGFGGLAGVWNAAIAGLNGPLGGLGSALGGFTGIIAAAGIALNLYTAALQLGSSDVRTFSAGAATVAGTIGGAIIGSIVPGVGTAIGALIGAALGGTVGGAAGSFGFFDDATQGQALARILTGQLNLEAALGNTFGEIGNIITGNALETNSPAGTALAILNPLAPVTILITLLTQGIGALFELFGFKNGQYQEKRDAANATARSALEGVSKGYSDQARKGDSAALLAALQNREGNIGTDNNTRGVFSIAMLTPEQAGRLGIDVSNSNVNDVNGQQRFEVGWDQFTKTQFDELLRLLALDQAQIPDTVAGRASINYLNQDNVEAVEAAIKEVAGNVLKAFVIFAEVRDKIKDLFDNIKSAISDFLPDDVRTAFEANILGPLQQSIIDIVTSDVSIEEITARMQVLQATLTAYAGIVVLYGQISQDIAAGSGDFAFALKQGTDAVIRGLRDQQKAIDKAFLEVGLTQADADIISGKTSTDDNEIGGVLQEIIDRAVASVDLSPELTLEKLTKIRELVLARYEAEKEAILGLENQVKGLWEGVGNAIIGLQTILVGLELHAGGTVNLLSAMILNFKNLANTSISTAEALFAVNAGFALMVAVLPGLVQDLVSRQIYVGEPGAGGGLTAPRGPGGGVANPINSVHDILAFVHANIGPLIEGANTQVNAANAAGDTAGALAIIAQIGENLKSAFTAAMAAVDQWEAATISAIQEQTAAYIRSIEQSRDAQIAPLNEEKRLNQEKLDDLQDQRDALEELKDPIEELVRGVDDKIKPLTKQLKDIDRIIEGYQRTQAGLNKEIAKAERIYNSQVKVIDDLTDSLHDQLDAAQRGYDIQVKINNRRKEDAQDLIDEADRVYNGYVKGIRLQTEALQDQLDVAQKVYDGLIRTIDLQRQAIREQLQPLEDQLEVLARYRASIQRLADAYQHNIKIQLHGLELQRRGLEEAIELVEEWADAIQGIRDYLLELALSGQAPPDVQGQYDLAKQNFDAQNAAFRADPSAEGLSGLQDAAAKLLTAAEPLFARASLDYEGLYNSIVRALEDAVGVGVGIGGDPASLDDLKDQLKIITDQIDALNFSSSEAAYYMELALYELQLQQQALEDLKQPLEDQLTILDRQAELYTRLLDEYKQPLQDQLDVLNRQEALLTRQLTAYKEPLEEQIRILNLQSRDLARLMDEYKAPLEEQIRILEEQKKNLARLLEEYKDPLLQQLEALQDLIDAQEELKIPIEAQIDVLNESKELLQDQLDVLNKQEEDLARQEKKLTRTNALLDRQINTINESANRQIENANRWAEIAIQETKDAAKLARTNLEAYFTPLLTGVADALGVGFVANREALLQSILNLTGGVNTAAWLRERWDASVTALTAIQLYIETKLSGAIAEAVDLTTPDEDDLLINTLNGVNTTLGILNGTLIDINARLHPPVDGTVGGGSPTALGGMLRVPNTGTILVHKDEVVVPMPFAEAYRASGAWMGSGGPGGGETIVTISPGAIQISGANDPAAVSNAVMSGLERELRTGGRFRQIISKIPRG